MAHGLSSPLDRDGHLANGRTQRAARLRSTLGSARRRFVFGVVVVLVLSLHAFVTRRVTAQMEDFARTDQMPARIAVAYVRTLDIAVPPNRSPHAAREPAAIAPPAAPPVVRAASAAASNAERRAEARAAARARLAADADRARAREAQAHLDAAGTAAAAASASLASASVPVSEASGPSSVPSAMSVGSSSTTSASDLATASTTASTTASATASAAAPSASSAEPVGLKLAGAAQPASSAASSADGFDWPASTRVSYHLVGNYRGPVDGRAQVEWIRIGARYQVNIDLLVGPDFAPIISRRMSSEGEVGPAGLVPQRYDEDTQVVFRDRRRVTVLFEPDAVVLGNGQRRERLPGVQDTASQFIQMTWFFTMRPESLQVGKAVEVPLALPRNTDRWVYDVIGEETLQTSFGSLQAFHLKPRRAVQKPGDLSAEVWFAPALRYLPVRIRIEQDATTFLDLTISRKPEMAAS
jgi:hypothetical protein